MPENQNPLSRYFRQPAIYIKLPSDGKFYGDNAVDIPANGELPVYPMTALDEITYRTADALFNGDAVVSVIKSCVPNIKDPWKMPAIDLDTVLVGIRIASYGHQMDFDSHCPYCDNENSFGVDLRGILDGIKIPDYEAKIQHGDVEIFFKPLTYTQVNQNAMVQFEDQKLLEILPNADIPDDEKIKRINDAFIALSKMTMSAVAQSISVIRAGGEVVIDPTWIEEYVTNCDRDMFNRIRDHIVELKSQSELKPLKIRCQNHECGKEYESPFTLDVSNFFGSAS